MGNLSSVNNVNLIIASLGGSPQPVILSVAANHPDRIIFLSSHDTVKLSADVLGALDFQPEVEYEIVDNPNLLSECYQKCRLCIDRAEKHGYLPDQILVDYTGGTKVMTAALLLASIGKHFQFNYVGGKQRDKDGVGVVLNGHEKFFNEMSPWIVFAEEERRKVATLFNSRRYYSVIEIIDSLNMGRVPVKIMRYFKTLRQVSDGLLNWDQFNIKKAYELISQGMVMLEEHCQLYKQSDLTDFSAQVKGMVVRLQEILKKTKGLTIPHTLLIDDLLNNARRKIADKRNDDAAARIYRALELYGQLCFLQVTGSENDSVDPDIVPEKIRDDYIRRYLDRSSGTLKLPLQATFNFLECKGHGAGIRFKQQLKKIKNIQSNRNKSILAHGLAPVSDGAVKSIFNTVADFVQFNNSYDFPLLP